MSVRLPPSPVTTRYLQAKPSLGGLPAIWPSFRVRRSSGGRLRILSWQTSAVRASGPTHGSRTRRSLGDRGSTLTSSSQGPISADVRASAESSSIAAHGSMACHSRRMWTLQALGPGWTAIRAKTGLNTGPNPRTPSPSVRHPTKRPVDGAASSRQTGNVTTAQIIGRLPTHVARGRSVGLRGSIGRAGVCYPCGSSS